MQIAKEKTKIKKSSVFLKDLKSNYDLYLISLIPLAVLIIFSYAPMYGVQIAFKDFMANKGITGSPWVGFEHFERLFSGHYFGRIIKNTLTLSIYNLVVSFPFPIILAIMLNESKNKIAMKTVQMTTYMPHFISTVLMASIILVFFERGTGFVNNIFERLGMERIAFMATPKYFKHIYVWSGVWQGTGWGTIIYISALAGIDPSLKEAASIDGANRLQKIWHVDLPGILPTIVTVLILNVGSVMSLGFDKAYLLQNDLNLEASEIISTYVYKVGLQKNDYSFGTAVGLFNSVINLILLVTTNTISKKVNETSLW